MFVLILLLVVVLILLVVGVLGVFGVASHFWSLHVLSWRPLSLSCWMGLLGLCSCWLLLLSLWLRAGHSSGTRALLGSAAGSLLRLLLLLLLLLLLWLPLLRGHLLLRPHWLQLLWLGSVLLGLTARRVLVVFLIDLGYRVLLAAPKCGL